MARITIAQSGTLQLQVDNAEGAFVIHDTASRTTYAEVPMMKQTELLAFYLIAAIQQISDADIESLFDLVPETP